MQITAQRRWIKILDQIPTGSEISVFGITADQLIDDQIIRLREPIAWWRQTDAKVSNSKSAKTVLIFPTMLVRFVLRFHKVTTVLSVRPLQQQRTCPRTDGQQWARSKTPPNCSHLPPCPRPRCEAYRSALPGVGGWGGNLHL